MDNRLGGDSRAVQLGGVGDEATEVGDEMAGIAALEDLAGGGGGEEDEEMAMGEAAAREGTAGGMGGGGAGGADEATTEPPDSPQLEALR